MVGSGSHRQCSSRVTKLFHNSAQGQLTPNFISNKVNAAQSKFENVSQNMAFTLVLIVNLVVKAHDRFHRGNQAYPWINFFPSRCFTDKRLGIQFPIIHRLWV